MVVQSNEGCSIISAAASETCFQVRLVCRGGSIVPLCFWFRAPVVVVAGWRCLSVCPTPEKMLADGSAWLNPCLVAHQWDMISSVKRPEVLSPFDGVSTKSLKARYIYKYISLSMLRLLSSNAQKLKKFWKSSKSCHLGIHLKALIDY